VRDVLRHYEADTIYLVGDIVDGWQLRSSWYWPQAHNDVVQKLLRQARKGVRVVYVPGNHDGFLRDYYGVHFGGVEVVEHALHVAADGRRYLVVHGDHFDSWSRRRAGSRCSAARPTTSRSRLTGFSTPCADGSAFPIGRCPNGQS